MNDAMRERLSGLMDITAAIVGGTLLICLWAVVVTATVLVVATPFVLAAKIIQWIF